MYETHPSGITISGFLVANDRDKVKALAPEKLAEFDKRIGFKKYTAMNFYPVEEAFVQQQEAVKIIYGNINAENLYKFGRIDFDTIMNSQFGKIVKSLFFKDFRKGLLGASRLMGSVLKGVKIESREKTDHEIIIHFDSNKLFSPKYWQGFVEAYMESFEVKAEVTVTSSLEGLEIDVKWL